MDLISLLLFIGTLGLIAAMIYLDLSKYKFHFFMGIIVLGVALYIYGLIGNGETLNTIDLVLKAFGNTTAILRGIFRTTEISNRINNDLLFLLSAYAIHVIGFGYTYILIFTVFFNNLALKMRFFFIQKRPHYLILGDDEKVTYLLKSFEKETKKRHHSKAINVALPKALLANKEINTKYGFKPGFSTFDVSNQKLDSLLGSPKQDIILLSLLTKDTDVMALVEKLNRYYQHHPQSKLKSYILYQHKQHLPIYESFSQEKQKLRFFSYHQLIAQQLVLEFPLTSYLPKTMINFEKATLEDVKIQYHLLGFGQTNEDVYRHLFVTNQFPPKASRFFGKEFTSYANPPITYNIYRDPVMNPGVIRTFTTPNVNKRDYLPQPPISAASETIDTTFNDGQFLTAIANQVHKSDDYQIFVIAFDEDVFNLRVLQQVLSWTIERRLQKFQIFVQILNRDYQQTSQLFKNPNVIPFGFGDYGYSLNQITNPVFTHIAKNIHGTLNPNKPFDALLAQEKENLLYEAISLRFKLNLMGLDLAPQRKGLSEDKFMKRYDEDDQSRFHQVHPRAKNDADLNRYKPVAKKIRNLLARQEHLRWTANQMTQGYIPMSVEEMIMTKHYVDHQLKKDARLTSFEGLFELHEKLVHDLEFSFSDADLIYPYFHTMDHLYQIIQGTPFSVVDTIDEKNNRTVEMPISDTGNVKSKIKS
ncbi:MAG: hypothetical protein FJ352_01010 [Firmicutes bacterium]|nr:hypothetical protein [Bacillota bacterium]